MSRSKRVSGKLDNFLTPSQIEANKKRAFLSRVCLFIESQECCSSKQIASRFKKSKKYINELLEGNELFYREYLGPKKEDFQYCFMDIPPDVLFAEELRLPEDIMNPD